MSIYDKLLIIAYFLLIIFVQCKWQAALFKRNKPISHFWHGVIYAATIGPAVWVFWPKWWQVIVLGVVVRLAFFDPIMNLVRGKRPLLTYNGKGTTGSKIDQWENRFSVVWLTVLKLVYIAGFVIALIFIK